MCEEEGRKKGKVMYESCVQQREN